MKNEKFPFELQLFAEGGALPNTSESTGMSAEMKVFYEKRLIDQAEPRLVHDQFADFYPVPVGGGKTIEFRKYDSLPKATVPLDEGVTPDGQALNVSTITSEMHQYGGWTPLTDVLQMTAIDNNVVQATRILASQAGRTLDTITREVLAGGTNVIYAPKQGADGAETAVTSRAGLDLTCKLTPKLFFQAAAQLGAMNADTLGDSYVAIIHPYAAYDTSTPTPRPCTAARSASWATSASSRPARPRSGRTAPAPRTAAPPAARRSSTTRCSAPWCWARTPTASPSWRAGAWSTSSSSWAMATTP